MLQKHGLPHSGKKDELLERLVKHDEKKMDDFALEEELGNLEEFDEAKLEYVFWHVNIFQCGRMGCHLRLALLTSQVNESTLRERGREHAKEYSILTVPAFSLEN